MVDALSFSVALSFNPLVYLPVTCFKADSSNLWSFRGHYGTIHSQTPRHMIHTNIDMKCYLNFGNYNPSQLFKLQLQGNQSQEALQ